MIETSFLQAGDIFIWQNFPLYITIQKERRWFFYLGNNTIEAAVYKITTTTQHQHYTGNGSLINNNFFNIPAGIGGLEKDSILDLTRYFERIPEDIINRYRSDITKTGSLNQNYIDMLVNHLKKDKHIRPVYKQDIYNKLRDAGFSIKV